MNDLHDYWEKYPVVTEEIEDPNKFFKYHFHRSGHSVS